MTDFEQLIEALLLERYQRPPRDTPEICARRRATLEAALVGFHLPADQAKKRAAKQRRHLRRIA